MRYLTIVILCTLCSPSIFCQSDLEDWEIGDVVKIHLSEGSSIRGEIIDLGEEGITLRSDGLGVITISQDRISSIGQSGLIKSKKRQDFEYYETMPYKNFLTETAIPLEDGLTIYDNVMILGNGVSHGITKNLSITAGLELLSPIVGESVV